MYRVHCIGPRGITLSLTYVVRTNFNLTYASRYDTPFTMRWVLGQISNFEYLMAVNFAVGRTMSDSLYHPCKLLNRVALLSLLKGRQSFNSHNSFLRPFTTLSTTLGY